MKEYTGRAFDDHGDKITFAGTAESIKEIDKDELVKVSGVDDISGIFTLRGTVNDAKDLKSLLKNTDIFLVDVMENNVITKDVQRRIKAQANLSLKDEQPIEVNIHSPFWFIEKE